MDPCILRSPLCSKPTVLNSPTSRKQFSHKFTHPNRHHLPILRATEPAATSKDAESNREEATGTEPPPPRPAPRTLTVRYRSKNQARQESTNRARPPPPPPKKEWESMTMGEKALELYVGEKGLLFWLNKLAYASIFIIIGGWILFRFVGPSLGLYQLDAPPLAPESVFKGSVPP